MKMYKIYTIPNVITCIRVALVFPILICLFREKIMLATILFITAAVTDFIDGWIARKFNQKSEVGSLIDPFADKLLLNSLFITLGAKGWIPNILWIAVMLRDIIVGMDSLYVFCVSHLFEAKPSFYGKTFTLFQIFTIGLVLFEKLNIPLYNKHLLIFCMYMTVILAFASLIDYLLKGMKIVKNNRVKM
ncbi:MAG: CDP-diacylglycerol--glycerol-3-phosphate 3-phosphatidyltransferase [Deltaproteobacteria bacterium]|nr:CDP-diacylglycerol--glycerol-3-phosphate 3-phosphatidyltransferase [Deltaproteobacteria bacterium]